MLMLSASAEPAFVEGKEMEALYAQTAFPVIDLAETGRSIERHRRDAGLSVRDLQTYFGFEYPQAIYKWQHGECLPTVDNLLALSKLLRVPMEELLVYNGQEAHFFWRFLFLSPGQKTGLYHRISETAPFAAPRLRRFRRSLSFAFSARTSDGPPCGTHRPPYPRPRKARSRWRRSPFPKAGRRRPWPRRGTDLPAL